MKKSFLLLILSFTIQLSYAECAFSGFKFYPEKREISQNSIFIIEGYSYSQKVINSFSKNRQAYLESEDGTIVDLLLEEILIGQMGLTQAVFKPSIKLELNKKYFLKFSHLTENENYHELTRYNSSKAEHEPVAWEVTESHSLELNLNLSLEFVQTEVEYYGCGPAAYAVFQSKNPTESEVWYKTEVYDETTKTSTTFIVDTREGIIKVGHGMCSGGFTFNEEGTYKVKFTPMNIDGKKLATTEWKSFESPFKNSLGY